MRGKSLASAQLVALVLLFTIFIVAGCSKKNVQSTSTGTDTQLATSRQSPATSEKGLGKKSVPGTTESQAAGDQKRSAGKTQESTARMQEKETSLEPAGKSSSGVFSDTIEVGPSAKKGLREERVGESTFVAKADPEEIEARKAKQLRQEADRRQLAEIHFAFDQWTLPQDEMKNLMEDAEVLKQNPMKKLRLEGHCDERGTPEYNLVLGEKRAETVRRYLLELGITNPVVVRSFGKERPVCTEADESCHAKNRRVHLSLEATP
jgi:peptidoglycan-associated lipoprotein